MAKECGYCGATVADSTIFCTKCGQRITSVNLSRRKKCPNCGQWLSAGRNSCLYCGYSPEEQHGDAGSGRPSGGKSEYFDPVSAPEDHKEAEPAKNQDPIKEPDQLTWSNPYHDKSAKKRICPGCGRPVEEEFQFCIMCGTPVLPDESVQNSSDSETHRFDSAAEDWKGESTWNKEEKPADDYSGLSLFHSYGGDAGQTLVQTPTKKDRSPGRQEGDSLYPADIFQFDESGNAGETGDFPVNSAPAQETPPVRGGLFDIPAEPSPVSGDNYNQPFDPSPVRGGIFDVPGEPSPAPGGDYEPSFEPSSVTERGYEPPFEPSPAPGGIFDVPEEPSPAPGGIFDAPFESSSDISSHEESPFPSDFGPDLWNVDRQSEKENPAESPDPAPAKGRPVDAAPEEEDTGGSSLFISSDLLKAMKKTEQEDEIPMGFRAPTKL